MEHRGVVGCLRRRVLVGGCVDDLAHVAQEEGGDDSEAPGEAELEHEVESSVHGWLSKGASDWMVQQLTCHAADG